MRGIRDSGARYLFALLCCLAVAAPFAEAAFEDDAAGARVRGLAGAFGAVADDSEAVFRQPAGLSALARLDASLTYGRLFTGLSDGSEISDSILTIGLPLTKNGRGAGFGYKSIALEGAYREETFAGAFGCRVSRHVAAGVAIRYLRLNYGADDYTRIDPVLAAQQGKSAFDGDAGIRVDLPARLTLSLVRQNLSGADLGMHEEARLQARDRVGLAYREDTFLMAAEYVRDGAENRLLSGMEKTLAGGALALRLGVGWGTRDFRKITSGLRVNVGGFGMDYAFEFPLGGIDHTSGTHYVALVLRAPAGTGKKAQAHTAKLTKMLPRELPGMAPINEPPAVVVPPLPVPALLPACTDALRTPLTASLNFEPVISSTTQRLCRSIETSTSNIVELPPAVPVQKAQSENREKKAVAPPALPTEPAAARGGAASRTHKTAAGDTLPSLAERYYGRRSDWYKIYEANKDRIEKGALEPGQVLIIP